MSMRRLIQFAVIWLALLGASAAVAAESSCVKCHTEEGTLKSLFVPPTATAEEGEG